MSLQSANITFIGCLNTESNASLSSLSIATHLHENLRWCIELWDHWLSRSQYAMGGGSVLEARWHHRHSTDIDFFLEQSAFQALGEEVRNDIEQHLHKLNERGEISGLEVHNSGYMFESPHGSASLFGTYRLTNSPISNDVVTEWEVPTESSTEILFRKIRGRMINGTTYLARDVYDVVCAYVHDRDSLDSAFHHLEPREVASLVYDVDCGASHVYSLERILDPRYPHLTESLDTFNFVAGAVLSRNVTATASSAIDEIFGKDAN